MFNIREYLKKFKQIGLDKESQKKEILEVLKEYGVNSFEIKNKILKVNASSIVKNQIYIKKQEILKKLPNLIDIN